MPKFLMEASLTTQGVKGVQSEEGRPVGKRCVGVIPAGSSPPMWAMLREH
jgi:hypothetical protein